MDQSPFTLFPAGFVTVGRLTWWIARLNPYPIRQRASVAKMSQSLRRRSVEGCVSSEFWTGTEQIHAPWIRSRDLVGHCLARLGALAQAGIVGRD
jgi:hypothetical protein